MAPKADFKPPKQLAACADMLYALREERYALQHQAERIEEKEKLLREHLIEQLPKGDASGISGKTARVFVENVQVARVEDWDALYAHIKKTGSFELLQRRPSETAIRERWDAGKAVPGVTTLTNPVLRLNKV